MDTNKDYQKHLEQQKRMMMKKRRKKRAKRRLIVFLFLLICTGVIVTAFKAPFFNITQVICEGQQKFTQEQLLQIAGITEGKNIFSTSIQMVKDNLLKNSEIAEVDVKRVFPNKVRIIVAEAVPVAYMVQGKTHLLIDKKGKIIRITEDAEDEQLKNIPLAKGVEIVSVDPGKIVSAENDSRAANLYVCLGLLDREKMANKVNFVDFSDLSDIKIDYENRIFMLLGNYDELEYKLKFVKKVIDENMTEHEKAQFDYRGDKLYVGSRVEADEETAENKEADEKKQDNQEKQETVDESKNAESEEDSTQDTGAAVA